MKLIGSRDILTEGAARVGGPPPPGTGPGARYDAAYPLALLAVTSLTPTEAQQSGDVQTPLPPVAKPKALGAPLVEAAADYAARPDPCALLGARPGSGPLFCEVLTFAVFAPRSSGQGDPPRVHISDHWCYRMGVGRHDGAGCLQAAARCRSAAGIAPAADAGLANAGLEPWRKRPAQPSVSVRYRRTRRPPWDTGGPGGSRGRPVAAASAASVVTIPARQPVNRAISTFPNAP